MKKFLAKRLEGRYSSLWASVFAIVLTMITASVLLLIMGKNPVVAFQSFLQGCGFLPKAKYGGGSGMLSDLFDFLNYLAPLMLASLAFIAGFKTGLFNIGISGQMLLSGFLATVMVGYNKSLSPAVAKPLVILIGIAAGGLVGAFIGFLKYRFNIHEVVSTIMINYIISYLTGFFINNNYVDMMTRTSRVCTAAARLTWTNVKIGGVNCKVPLGIVIAILIAFAVQFLFAKTSFGFELKAVGLNPKCAKYFGVGVGKSIVLSMAISGVLAGLAGVTYYLGYTNTIIPKNLVGMGYDSISVALLGNSSPIGAIFASIIVSIFQQGANYMSSRVGVAKEIASLITGIMLLYASCGNYMKMLAHSVIQKEADKTSNREEEER
ncbi:MAG: ABC transporter permease [Anaerolineaceae bacterium]|nr:ABC transporter permease [Anaerolineaceae bacterium]